MQLAEVNSLNSLHDQSLRLRQSCVTGKFGAHHGKMHAINVRIVPILISIDGHLMALIVPSALSLTFINN